MPIAAVAVLLCASLRVGSDERHYLLHVPKTAKANAPLVLVFHGGGGHAAGMPRLTGFDALADAKGFIVAYPEGGGAHWNDTRGLSAADDVAFVGALIDELARTLSIDRSRVFATGYSNGGFFAQRLACDLADRIAGVASVAATMPETLVCKPARAVPVMFVHGTGDPVVLIGGGVVGQGHGRSLSLAAAAKFWRDQDGASGEAVATDLGAGVHRDTWSGRAEVVVYTIRGGGHAWPRGRDMDATAGIWAFFGRQRLR